MIRSRLTRLLDEQGQRAVLVAISDLESQRQHSRAPGARGRKKRLTPAWRLEIPPGNPLRFIPTTASQDLRYSFVTDIACKIDQPRDGRITGEHKIAVRMWTSDERLYFREAYDAETILQNVEESGRRRVILRFHFDYANTGQPGPKHHLQIGGKQHTGEFCWFPGNIRVPRFCHHPLSLLMACEFVVRTFYPQSHATLEQEASWRGAIADAQNTYLPAYYELQGLNAVAMSNSLLGKLWNAI